MISTRSWTEIEDVRLRIKSEMYARAPEKTFIVAFVGATRRAGTSTMAVAVARAFHEAEMRGKTLLLGIAGHGKSVDKIARATKPPEPANNDAGFASNRTTGDMEEKTAYTPAVLQQVKKSKKGFDVLTKEDAQDMRRLFERNSPFWPEVTQRYQVAFIDSGTVGSEPHIAAATKADLTLLVVDGTKITRSELSRLRERLEQARLMPDGVVLNRKKEYLPRIFRAAVE
ncbi:MAG: hypothetical protein AAFW87_11850 [Pseudomonadota bacterium]